MWLCKNYLGKFVLPHNTTLGLLSAYSNYKSQDSLKWNHEDESAMKLLQLSDLTIKYTERVLCAPKRATSETTLHALDLRTPAFLNQR